MSRKGFNRELALSSALMPDLRSAPAPHDPIEFAVALTADEPDASYAAGMPDRTPAVDSSLAACLALMLDEVDYGLLLLDATGRVRVVNHAARMELDASHPLQLADGQLRTRSRHDAPELATALQGALRGVRHLLLVGEGDSRIGVAVVPLGARALDGAPGTMLLLGRRRVVQNLSVQFFARSRRLTPAETRVLQALCAGVPPAKIADELGVRISTIRTQIGGIREKTGARSIRALVRMVAVLPPMVPALRSPFGLLSADGVAQG